MSNTVYHYTSPSGIFNILKNKTLRFTDCQYLSDKGELIYIREPFEVAYKKIRKEHDKLTDDVEKITNNILLSPYEHLSLGKSLECSETSNRLRIKFDYHRYYVLCASLNSDTANMWSYYVKNGVYRGYNIGIDINFIKEWFADYENDYIEFISGKVIYDKNEQIEMIYSKLKDLYSKYNASEQSGIISNDMFVDMFIDDLYEYIHKQKLFFKNPAFSSEEEYRFVLKINNEFPSNRNLSLDFRVGESGVITPYVKWMFELCEKEKIFKQITLAPMIEADLAEESFKRFLATTVQKNIEIKHSSIKLRY